MNHIPDSSPVLATTNEAPTNTPGLPQNEAVRFEPEGKLPTVLPCDVGFAVDLSANHADYKPNPQPDANSGRHPRAKVKGRLASRHDGNYVTFQVMAFIKDRLIPANHGLKPGDRLWGTVNGIPIEFRVNRRNCSTLAAHFPPELKLPQITEAGLQPEVYEIVLFEPPGTTRDPVLEVLMSINYAAILIPYCSRAGKEVAS